MKEINELLRTVGATVFAIGVVSYFVVGWATILKKRPQEITKEMRYWVTLCLLLIGIGLKVFSM